MRISQPAPVSTPRYSDEEAFYKLRHDQLLVIKTHRKEMERLVAEESSRLLGSITPATDRRCPPDMTYLTPHTLKPLFESLEQKLASIPLSDSEELFPQPHRIITPETDRRCPPGHVYLVQPHRFSEPNT